MVSAAVRELSGTPCSTLSPSAPSLATVTTAYSISHKLCPQLSSTLRGFTAIHICMASLLLQLFMAQSQVAHNSQVAVSGYCHQKKKKIQFQNRFT